MNIYLLVLTAVELCITIILAIIFEKGLAFLENPLEAYSKHALFALALITVLTLGGVGSIMVQSVKITDVCAVMVLMIVSYLGGGGVGAAMGLAIAVVLGITTGGLIVLVATYSVSGFLAGFLKDLGKWGSIFGGEYWIIYNSTTTTFQDSDYFNFLSMGNRDGGFFIHTQAGFFICLQLFS